MRQCLRILLYLSIFWLIFEVVIHELFLLYNHDLSQQLTGSEIIRIFSTAKYEQILFTDYNNR